MSRRAPDFQQIRMLLQAVQKLDEDLEQIFRDEAAQEAQLRLSCAESSREQAVEQLSQIPLEELRTARSGIRTGVLEQAGYRTLLDLYRERDYRLLQVDGIGEKQVSAIRALLEEFILQLSQHARLRIDPGTAAGQAMIAEAARYLKAQPVRQDAAVMREDLHDYVQGLTESVVIRGRLRWLFSRRETRERTILAVAELTAFCRGPEFARARRFVDLYAAAKAVTQEEAVTDYRRNNAAYYALLENLTGITVPQEMLYSSIPARLAAQINAVQPDLRGFKGNLRAYQAFGVRYILTQKRVLLGDEMGLGKTIQGIAAMVHLEAETPGSRFLVVCPASVMVNWCREIGRFSHLHVCLLHGQFLDDAFEEWLDRAGVAVTNYESMGKLVGRIDGQMKLSMLVIDEAHYIKNPEAQRTRHIHALEEESERILLMSGTPLENRVAEMCELIGFVRPDLVPQIRESAAIRHADAFRELLAPVYLRRRRDQVLEELPPLTEESEWCTMTPEDTQAYVLQVAASNFQGMRRVSFLQEDPHTSSKAARLLELCREAAEEGRKILVYSYFRETIRKVRDLLKEVAEEPDNGGRYCGEITGSTPADERQAIVDRFTEALDGSILLCQVQAGGTGLNIQAASVIFFCEPQIKPSLTRQAISRAFRMGQAQNVLVYHLLCEGTVDEAVMQILQGKEEEFDLYADESVMGDAADALPDRAWIQEVIEREHQRYLPAVIN